MRSNMARKHLSRHILQTACGNILNLQLNAVGDSLVS